MNIFTKDASPIKKEIEELLVLINETKTTSLPIYQTTESLISFYELITDSNTDYYERLMKGKYPFIEKQKQILENKKIRNIINTKEVHKNLITSLSNYYEEIENFSKIENSNEAMKTDGKEMYEIIQDFFKKRNRNVACVFDYLIKEKRIFEIPNKSELDNAYNLLNLYKNNFYIFIKKDANMVTTMANIVHEIGHTMDDLQMLSSGGHNRRRKCNYYTGKSLLIEVISTMYEKEFLEFLLDEGIDRNAVEQEITSHFTSLYGYLEETELLLCLPDHLLEEERYKRISKQDFLAYLEKDSSILVNQDAIFHPSNINLPTNLEYCYGSVLATYFSHLKHYDNSRYQENFHNFLKVRADYFSPNFFESIGTTPQELVDIVREDCEEFSSKRMIK